MTEDYAAPPKHFPETYNATTSTTATKTKPEQTPLQTNMDSSLIVGATEVSHPLTGWKTETDDEVEEEELHEDEEDDQGYGHVSDVRTSRAEERTQSRERGRVEEENLSGKIASLNIEIRDGRNSVERKKMEEGKVEEEKEEERQTNAVSPPPSLEVEVESKEKAVTFDGEAEDVEEEGEKTGEDDEEEEGADLVKEGAGGGNEYDEEEAMGRAERGSSEFDDAYLLKVNTNQASMRRFSSTSITSSSEQVTRLKIN